MLLQQVFHCFSEHSLRATDLVQQHHALIARHLKCSVEQLDYLAPLRRRHAYYYRIFSPLAGTAIALLARPWQQANRV